MIDLYLRFGTREAAIAALEPLGMTYTDEDGVTQISTGSHQFAIWEVGEIPGYTGWHVNLRLIDESLDCTSLDPFRVYPPYPICVWA
jgi:hypothetical protein